jgi:hypothetical protein
MTMFPQELHTEMDGCMHNLTKTTLVQTRYPLPVARVLGDYYRLSLTTGHGCLSHIQRLSGTACRYVRVESPRLDHARIHEAKCQRFWSQAAASFWDEQARPLSGHLRAHPTLHSYSSTTVQNRQEAT